MLTKKLTKLSLAFVLLATATVHAQTFNLLYSFAGGATDGQAPYAGLIADRSGNYYGTTQLGGASGNGTVFELSNTGQVTILYSFGGVDGSIPTGRLAIDRSGNLYGTTYVGGNGNGNVFELSNSGGTWTEKQLYVFTGGTDGALPYAGLLLVGNRLFGTTEYGGKNGMGTVFQLKNTLGIWTQKVLYSFKGGILDGAVPNGGLVRDSATGTLFGTTTLGGNVACNGGCGTIFALTKRGKESVLHFFAAAPDGASPWGGLLLSASVLYGTTYGGGTSNNCPASKGCGTVFSIPESGAGYSVLYSLRGIGNGSSDGNNPYAGLVQDSAGNLYGTSSAGGVSGGGMVFELVAPNYTTETVLHSFTGTDGGAPTCDLVAVGSGTPTLYGTTQRGGKNQDGVLFSLVP